MKIEASQIKRLLAEETESGAHLIAQVVNEAEEAKQLMRTAGFGVTGQGILETTKLVLAALPENLSAWRESFGLERA